MTFECIGKSTAIQKPNVGIIYQNTGTTTPPFELKGQPLSNPPESLKNVIQNVRKSNAVIDTSRSDYTADKNYYSVKVNTENIIGRNPNTTLRYDGETFMLEFIAVHRNIWYTTSDTVPQVSIIFTNSRGHIFHICIPILLKNSNADENQFLKYWLYRKPSGRMPVGMTVNELLNFREGINQKVNFQTLEYCLEVNQTIQQTRYILCIFENGLNVNVNELPDWFRQDNTLNNLNSQKIPTEVNANKINTFILKKKFDDILNFMFRGTFYKNRNDTRIVNDTIYFDEKRTQSVIQPSYFTVTSRQIAGSMVKTPLQTGPNKRALQNVKCYPIDLINQIDKDGNIVIDEETNKPVDVKSVKGEGEKDTTDPNLAIDLEQKQKENQQRVIFWIIFTIVFLVVISIVLALIVYFLKGKSYSPAMSPVVINSPT